MSEMPRYRCALEKGFLPKTQEVWFAKTQTVGANQRVEYGDEFYYDGKPGKWMEPLNDAARERCEALVGDNQRQRVEAERSVSNTPLKPPRSGLTRALTDAQAFSQPTDTVVPDDLPRMERAPPRRRAATKAS